MKRLLPLFLLLSLLPANAQVAKHKPHAVTLKWDPPAAGAYQASVVGYNVYRSNEEHGKYTAIARTVTERTYTDTKVKSRHTYYYRVTSVDAKGRESTATTSKATIP